MFTKIALSIAGLLTFLAIVAPVAQAYSAFNPTKSAATMVATSSGTDAMMAVSHG